jgi:hypothetical protein
MYHQLYLAFYIIALKYLNLVCDKTAFTHCHRTRVTQGLNNIAILNTTLKPGSSRFPYGRKNGGTIFLNGQFTILIVYTCKPHINHN